MNCNNCGAPVEAVHGERYFFCDYCHSFRFIESSEQSIDGVVATMDVADTCCPVCDDQPLVKAKLESQEVSHCPDCRGILMTSDRLGEVISQQIGTRPKATGNVVPLNPGELKRRLACPACQQRMDVHPYYGPGNSVIDSCYRCRLVWLDYGEVNTLVDAASRVPLWRLAHPS